MHARVRFPRTIAKSRVDGAPDCRCLGGSDAPVGIPPLHRSSWGLGRRGYPCPGRAGPPRIGRHPSELSTVAVRPSHRGRSVARRAAFAGADPDVPSRRRGLPPYADHAATDDWLRSDRFTSGSGGMDLREVRRVDGPLDQLYDCGRSSRHSPSSLLQRLESLHSSLGQS
jgi:hypothetical protein